MTPYTVQDFPCIIIHTARKMSKYGTFSGLYFPVFGLATETPRFTEYISNRQVTNKMIKKCAGKA